MRSTYSTEQPQYAQYRRLLLDKKAELLGELRITLDSLSGEPVPEQEDDRAPIVQDQAVAQQLNSLDYEELQLVNAALDRLESGKYGKCQDCGLFISPERLKAIPWAMRCVACEERMEPRASQENRPGACAPGRC